MSNLRIGDKFNLPVDSLSHVWSILAVRGAGKTYTAGVVVEEILERRLMPVVIIDPMDVWWGLKSSADGHAPGYPVIVMGGKHADVPLEPTAGALVADFFIQHRQSMVLSLGGEDRWPRSQMVRFFTDFGARLWQRNGGVPMELVVDEDDIFANQRPGKDELRCLGVSEDIAKRGRTPGINLMQLTQRSSNLNKNVLDETEVLVALRTTSPRDQDALESWFRHLPRAQQSRKAILLETWAKLPNGTAWFWWPEADLFQQVPIREKRTFDSSATPKLGEKPREPKVVAAVDLEKLKVAMAGTIERAKEDDPRALRIRIRELQAELAKLTVKMAGSAKEVKVPVLSAKQIGRLEKSSGRLLVVASSLNAVMAEISEGLRQWSTLMAITAIETDAHQRGEMGMPNSFAPPPRSDRVVLPNGDAPRLKAGARRMLEAVCVYPLGLTRRDLSALTSVAPGGTLSAYMASLLEPGLVTEEGGIVKATVHGKECGIHGQRPPETLEELLSLHGSKLKAGARRMAEYMARYGGYVERSTLSKEANVAPGGTLSAYVSSLVRNGIAEEQHGLGLRLSDVVRKLKRRVTV